MVAVCMALSTGKAKKCFTQLLLILRAGVTLPSPSGCILRWKGGRWQRRHKEPVVQGSRGSEGPAALSLASSSLVLLFENNGHAALFSGQETVRFSPVQMRNMWVRCIKKSEKGPESSDGPSLCKRHKLNS